jgi:hypothetical protein
MDKHKHPEMLESLGAVHDCPPDTHAGLFFATTCMMQHATHLQYDCTAVVGSRFANACVCWVPHADNRARQMRNIGPEGKLAACEVVERHSCDKASDPALPMAKEKVRTRQRDKMAHLPGHCHPHVSDARQRVG